MTKEPPTAIERLRELESAMDQCCTLMERNAKATAKLADLMVRQARLIIDLQTRVIELEKA